jgi:hypothetical protein
MSQAMNQIALAKASDAADKAVDAARAALWANLSQQAQVDLDAARAAAQAAGDAIRAAYARMAWDGVCRQADADAGAAHSRVFAAALRCGMGDIAGRLADRAADRARDAAYAANRKFASPSSIINAGGAL